MSKSGEAAVVRYIKNQFEHHRKRTFKEELLSLLRKHNLDYDPRVTSGTEFQCRTYGAQIMPA